MFLDYFVCEFGSMFATCFVNQLLYHSYMTYLMSVILQLIESSLNLLNIESFFTESIDYCNQTSKKKAFQEDV